MSKSFILRRCLLVLSLFLLAAVCGWADPLLPHLIGDHMVLQQQRPIHIWGKADPGEQIVVSLAGVKRSTAAGASRSWSVQLPARRAGGPFTMSIRGKREILLKDVMIGEVWVASGQSNMTFALSGSDGAAEEIPKADYPNLRLFTVPKKVANQPQADTLPASWRACTPESAKEFSAVAYYFARELHRKLNVPIGIIEDAWPGTAIEEWIAPDALMRISGHTAPHVPVDRQPFSLEFDDFELVPAAPESRPDSFSNFDDSTSKNSTGGYWSYTWNDAPATSVDLISPGRGNRGYAIRVSGGTDASDDSRLVARLHVDNSPADLSAYDGIRFWVRGNGSFRLLTLQPSITDWDNYSTKPVQASGEWRQEFVAFKDLRQEGWGVVKDLTLAALEGIAIECLPASGYPDRPQSGLYEGMMAPVLPYAFRGAIWYQGESNALAAYSYQKLLPGLISNWRAVARDQFPFLIVQLPNHGAIPEQPGESAWAELREAQLLTMEQVPDTGMAVTIDVGDPKDLHPHRKAEVGERLALWAMGTTYARPIVYSGPIYRSAKADGNRVVIEFDHVGGGLVGDAEGRVKGFAIAGADHKFHWADAVIQGATVVVSSPEVGHPVAVRYAWGDSPICNLYNREGLPASPFRTDDWPGITH
jgi:sialate O-acetylesterase